MHQNKEEHREGKSEGKRQDTFHRQKSLGPSANLVRSIGRSFGKECVQQ